MLKNKTAIVAKGLAGNQCLLGRDWQRSIPALSQALGDLATTVQNMSQCSSNVSDKMQTNKNHHNKTEGK